MSISIQPVATAYIRRGWSPIPIPFKTKAPLVRGWQQLRIDQAEVSKHFSHPEQNIGVLLGEPSGWLVDIDLDHKRCVELADEFLPATDTVFGRPGKPRSHRLYRVTKPVATRKFKSKSAGMLVELRSTGTQTVFPPSVHETDEQIAWETENAEPAEVDPEILIDALKRLSDTVKRELGELAERKQPKANPTNDTTTPEAIPSVERASRCLDAMRRMQIADSNDGSGRLFAAACRCVEHDLNEIEALAAIRTYATECPFPRDWTEGEICERLRDAELKCARGSALVAKTQGAPAGKVSQADLLVQIAQQAELFHDDDEAFASFEVKGHRETARVTSKPFRRWLANQFYETERKAAGGQAVQDALNTLAGQALFAGEQQSVQLRAADYDGAIWIDLLDDKRHAVCIDCNGWQIVRDSQVPIRFLRRKGMLPLPIPQTGGSVGELRRFLNLRDHQSWALTQAWLVAALRPSGPFPVLHIQGEQGTAKSTLARLLRFLIDPNKAALRSEPKEPRDLMIAAKHSRVVAFDNLSGLPGWLSDALCRLATGGGFSTRELYSDEEEVIFDAMRPAIINGIEPPASRPDLLDRCLNLHLEVIPEDQRKTENQVWAEFNLLAGRILGGLYSAVSIAMRELPNVKLSSIPRMADFCVWTVAAEPGLDIRKGGFFEAYQGDRADAHESVIEQSIVGTAVRNFITTHTTWTGTATELLAGLSVEPFTTEAQRRQPEWPKTSKKLAGDLRRLAPAMRGVGIKVQLPVKRMGREKRREITLELMGDQRAARAAQAANGPNHVENGNSVPPRNGSTSNGNGSTDESNGSTCHPDTNPKTQIAALAAHATHQIPTNSNTEERQTTQSSPEVMEL